MNSYFLNDILECSVCLKPLDEQNKVLPCQHTFCKSCLLSIVRSQKELRCPECRVVVRQRVDDLPSNILLIRLLDGIKLQQNQLLAHTEKHSRRHSVEGVLGDAHQVTESVPDGGKLFGRTVQQDQPAHANHARPTSAPHVSDTGGSPRPYSTAVYPYKSDHPSDLSFVKGDTVYLLKKIDDSWMSGECNGRTGLFPTNYVKIIQPLPAPRPYCTALYDFESKEEDQDRDCLLFSKNEKILVIRRVDENWAEGILRDKIGIFPLSFVKLNDEAKKILDVATHSPTAHIESSGDNSERSFGIKGVLGMGAAARRIVNNKQGGKNQKKRHSFPTFSSGKTKEDGASTSTHRHSMEILEGNPRDLEPTATSEPSPGPATDPGASQENSARLRQKRPMEITVPPTVESMSSSTGSSSSRNSAAKHLASSGVLKDRIDRSKSADQTTPRQTPTASKLQFLSGLVTASYSYHASKPDELQLIKGDSYRVTEVCKDGWCRGSHVKSGKEGVFPGNYVAPALPASSSRSPGLTSRSASGSSSSMSSSSSSSPVQVPKSNKTREPFTRNLKPHARQQNNHLKPTSGDRIPPPRPAAPVVTRPSTSDTSLSSPSGNATSSANHSSASSSKAAPSKSGSSRTSEKPDKRKDRSQLLLKMISVGSKKVKTTSSPTSPVPKQLVPHRENQTSTSQSKPDVKPLMRDKYRAVMNYPANEPDELDIKEGDIIVVHRRRDDGWFHGTQVKNGRTGLFPSTFVKRVSYEYS